MAVLLFDESNPTGGVVIGTYGTATWKQFDRLYASDGTPGPRRADRRRRTTPGPSQPIPPRHLGTALPQPP